MDFGDDRYDQYKDRTGLHLFSDRDHLDTDRLHRYDIRHHKDF